MRKILCIFAAAITLASCDDGPIYDNPVYDEEGAVVKMEGRLTGTQTWPENYSIAVGGFESIDNYAVISKVLPAADGAFTIVMSGVPANVEDVELCVLNRLRQRVMSFKTKELAGVRDTLLFDVGDVDVSMMAAIQQSVLDQSCVACHGANGYSAAGLDLTEGHSYADLVNAESRKLPGQKLVEPGNKENSVLHQLLNSDVSASWRQNHADMLNKERAAALLMLIDNWIDNGAKK